MTKSEFILELRKRLSGLPKQDIEERLNFYSEMIDDRMEEGVSEEAAVSEIGDVDVIAEQIIADTPLSTLTMERIKPKRRLGAWEIVLLALGAPIWLSLAIAAFSVILSLYAVLWSVIASLWSIFASFIACGVSGVLGGVTLLFTENAVTGMALIGASVVCCGLSILLFFGCREATKGIILLTKKVTLGIKKCFVRKENL